MAAGLTERRLEAGQGRDRRQNHRIRVPKGPQPENTHLPIVSRSSTHSLT